MSRVRNRFAVLSMLAMGLVLPAVAATGRVFGPDGKPLAGARACLLAAGAEALCVETDETGFYYLMDARVPGIRISKSGYLAMTVAAVDQQAPVVLPRAAAFRARLLDAETGEPVPTGEVTVQFTTGLRRGPFPYRGGWLQVLTIEPGPVVVMGEAAGYETSRGEPLDLVAGETAEIELRLRPSRPENPE